MPYEEENTGNVLGSFSFDRDQYFDPNDPASIAALTGRDHVQRQPAANRHQTSDALLRRVRAGCVENP